MAVHINLHVQSNEIRVFAMRAAVSVDTVLFENIMMGITGALDAWGMKHIHPAMM